MYHHNDTNRIKLNAIGVGGKALSVSIFNACCK